MTPDECQNLAKALCGRLGQHEYQVDIELATTPQILSYVNDAHLIEQKDPTMPTVPGAPVRA